MRTDMSITFIYKTEKRIVGLFSIIIDTAVIICYNFGNGKTAQYAARSEKQIWRNRYVPEKTADGFQHMEHVRFEHR